LDFVDYTLQKLAYVDRQIKKLKLADFPHEAGIEFLGVLEKRLATKSQHLTAFRELSG
jgi:hypothetical protein